MKKNQYFVLLSGDRQTVLKDLNRLLKRGYILSEIYSEKNDFYEEWFCELFHQSYVKRVKKFFDVLDNIESAGEFKTDSKITFVPVLLKQEGKKSNE